MPLVKIIDKFVRQHGYGQAAVIRKVSRKTYLKILALGNSIILEEVSKQQDFRKSNRLLAWTCCPKTCTSLCFPLNS